MKPKILIAIALLLSALYTFGGGVALAHGGKGVTVQPLTPKPGDVITVTGDELGASSTVEVRLIGTGVDIDLGEAQANDEGDFTAQFRVPADLKPGSYQLQAKGAESATTEITVVAAGSTESTTSATMAEAPATPVRERPLGETIGLVALFGVLAGLGLFFARTVRREPAS
jgi:hypothetical protein